MKFETQNYIVTCRDKEQIQGELFDRLLVFFKEHETFCGESLQQCDDPILAAPELLADIADKVFQFDVDCNWDAQV